MTQEERQTFTTFLAESQANWCELVVNAVAERLQITGFNFGDSTDMAWQIWQANCMDSDAEMVQTDALTAGSSFVLVQPDDDNATGVSITPESPREATVLYQPGSRRDAIAGYKRFTDIITQGIIEVLILPEVIATWMPNESTPEVVPNPAGTITLCEVCPQPRIGLPARSELHSAIPIQDRIHTTVFNRMVATDYGAFRQIWASGIRLARQVIQNEDGTQTTALTRPFDVGANRLLTAGDPAAKFGSFPESTLQGYLAAVEQDVETIASVTQTPSYYFGHTKMVNLSADAIKASEAGLVAKVKRRALHIGEDWERVMRLALGLVGDPGATMMDAEVIWADFETRSEAMLVDALTKMATLGVPKQVLWARWGASPQDIARWQQLSDQQAATDAANAAAALGAGDIARLLSQAPPALGTAPAAPTGIAPAVAGASGQQG